MVNKVNIKITLSIIIITSILTGSALIAEQSVVVEDSRGNKTRYTCPNTCEIVSTPSGIHITDSGGGWVEESPVYTF